MEPKWTGWVGSCESLYGLGLFFCVRYGDNRIFLNRGDIISEFKGISMVFTA